MLNINSEVKGLNNIDKVLSMVKNNTKQNDLNSFIKEKVQEVLLQVMSEKLVGGTTNDEEIQEYKKRNHFKDIKNGFILYNDTLALPGKYGHEYYPFSLALAFEYGVGITGAGKNIEGHWEYDIKGHGNEGWNYTKNGKTYHTTGYEGMEIYRTIAQRVNSNLKEWVNEYMNRGV